VVKPESSVETRPLTFGSLFAGIGGFDLGFERAGLTCSWQVEIDEFCQQVLARHWPAVRRWDDVRTFPPEPVDDWKVDVICGGFPCQDVSNAGPKVGIGGTRSGLWAEYARCTRLLRPRYVVVENVPALRSRGFARVLGDLASLGYDAEWDCVPASALGAPHQRDRLFLVAYPQGQGGWPVAGSVGPGEDAWVRGKAGQGHVQRRAGECQGFFGRLSASVGRCDWWTHQPGLGRLVHGVPGRLVVPRNHALGNALIPQVAELIGRRLVVAVSTRERPAGQVA
jgi:DNA (cytosine-5)-methyltransferase 1